MENIKLVIWDLDETFWKGTLSEEGIVPIQKNIDIVNELTNRGIINSIVSKNTFYEAKEKLIELEIWDKFIFPTIEWSAKGPLIKELIEKCQLRASNVLFIDDNHLNLKEAKYYNPDLNVFSNESIGDILNHKSFKGKNDINHTRLNQYKILEQKYVSRKKYSDNLNFLRDSEIKIILIEGNHLDKYVDRIEELLLRSNQLNFTKRRSNREEILSLLSNINYKSIAIRAFDKFGDYGIVGFYSLNTLNQTLIHFTFSCRILNLGIEQYLYSFLNFPKIEVTPEVAIDLDNTTPDWVTIDKNTSIIYTENNSPSSDNLVFFKGGCDLSQMLPYIKNNGFSFIEETNYPAKNNFPIHQEHTQVLIDSKSLSQENKLYAENSDFIPFVDENYYKTKMFDKKYKAIVYSVLMDYTQELYKNKIRDLTLPLGGYYNHWTDDKNDDTLYQSYKSRKIKIQNDTFTKFRNNFEHIGQITPEKFKENLNRIRMLIPIETPIIFINGAELNSPNSNEKDAYKRHKVMNNALDEFISISKNVYLLDIRNIVTKSELLTNNIRHYNRESYKKISLELLKILNSVTNLDIRQSISRKVILKQKLLQNKYFMILFRKSKLILSKIKKILNQ